MKYKILTAFTPEDMEDLVAALKESSHQEGLFSAPWQLRGDLSVVWLTPLNPDAEFQDNILYTQVMVTNV